VLNRPPQPLNEQVVVVAPFSIHADLDSVPLEEPGESLAGEVAALVGVEDLRPSLPDRLFSTSMQKPTSRVLESR